MKFDQPLQLTHSHTFKTADSLEKFLIRETTFWKEINTADTYPGSPFQAYSILSTALSYISRLIASNKDDPEEFNKRFFDQIVRRDTTNLINFTRLYFISRSTPLAKKILQITKDHDLATAFHFWSSSRNDYFKPQTFNAESFLGNLLAYEFRFQKSDITKRRQSEEESIDDIIEKTDELVTATNDQTETLRADTENELNSITEKFTATQNCADTLLKNQIRQHDEIFTGQLQEWSKEKDRLEALYKEDLRLKAPAEYWKNLAKEHNLKALYSAIISGIIIAITLIFLSTFFITWLSGEQHELDLGSLKGAFIFATIVAILGFTLKALSKFIFSSLHLAQDAREREQLTHFYLALCNETELKEKDRELVLTSLFSRSESGLLHNENGPTLPINDLTRSFRTSQ